ncbi:MAG: SDR family oxidoreductase [Pseudomonadales bacterium]|uniref:Putative short-chain dehydrogenase n=1 Tax=Oleiphilus messinensis TaxID=141451 RepID=A0A1Y0I4K8_9GAMM|nr:SDR family oxidoreductase [Oleiphilus messinensis]ARU54333.1 putative short-chain dehydrogenase [Oleiphilus messinensis]MCG8610294.1 SDR family oxidoreductase [Pseudomonadales bacterium]
MKSLANKVVALTGAGSGIGRALAIELARKGSHLALADVNADGLQETVEALPPGATVSTHIVDVAQKQQVYDWADTVVKQHGGVDVIINNAGVASQCSIEDISYDDFNWVFDIVFYGVLYGTKAFLPYLHQRPEGHIINISSVNGFFPFPGNSPYNCAKHAVKALNQTLIQELAGANIHVTSVHPGGIKTNIVRNARHIKALDGTRDAAEAAARFDKIASTTPEKAAQTIVSGILKNKQRLLVGTDAYLLDGLTRLFPQRFSNLVGRVMLRGARPGDKSSPAHRI